MEDVLEEWITERQKLQLDEGHADGEDNAFVTLLTKVCSFFPAASNCFGCFKQLSLRHDIAAKIREINKKLDAIAPQKDWLEFVQNVSNNVKKPERMQTTRLIDVGEVLGRVDERKELLSKLLGESSEQQKNLHIISLVGLGGIGKTTLAQLVCNDDKVIEKFKVIWVCVSDIFDEIRFAKAFIEGKDGFAHSSSEFGSLMEHIRVSIEGKKNFLVLDDVWDVDYNKWKPFSYCLQKGLHKGSKILVTTRNESVARKMESTNIIFIKQLAEEECQLLIKRLAFSNDSLENCQQLEGIVEKIACNCKGFPLAAKQMGILLRTKNTKEQWQSISSSEIWTVEEIVKHLLPSLLLSYNDLPSMIKRCFSYCAVSQKDSNMIEKELNALWMAQGYLNAEENKEMEMIGKEYFETLARCSLFQELKKDAYGDNWSCRMHDIVHGFAKFVSRKECLWLEINGSKQSFMNSFGEKVRHLGLNYEGGAPFPMSIDRLSRLRTLLIYDGSLNPSLDSSFLRELLSKLVCLRALVIRSGHSRITKIPENVGKLIHLKYLNLSGLSIARLPETLCGLYNLQKLDIGLCLYLTELPVGIGKLINMRSLLNTGTDLLKYMPLGISKLTSLRTLGKFIVGGGVEGSKTCRLESLKNLQLLRECRIEGLGNMSNLDEAHRVELKKKEKLLRLGLFCDEVVDGKDEEGRRKNEKDQQLLEALEPPSNVEELQIGFYGGNIFPKWLTSLNNLRSLVLGDCKNCEHLPPLGKLPLEKLTIDNLDSVKRVGSEFLGTAESCDDDPSASSSSSFTAFPNLKSLTIGRMKELGEWDYRITRKENISIMPCLSSLLIGRCPNLKVLPDYLLKTTTLQKLKIIGCQIMEELPILEDHRKTDKLSLSSLEIWDCPKLTVLPDYLLQTTTLQILSIMGCPILEERYREEKGEDWHNISRIPHRYIW